jgi:hypothetical protein
MHVHASRSELHRKGSADIRTPRFNHVSPRAAELVDAVAGVGVGGRSGERPSLRTLVRRQLQDPEGARATTRAPAARATA